tara:strand:- start:2 stop:1399 length:1398 start_codon:yes stop_codon:yes gene_type:complete
MKELDQLVENFFQPKRDTLGLDQLVEMVEEVMGEAVDCKSQAPKAANMRFEYVVIEAARKRVDAPQNDGSVYECARGEWYANPATGERTREGVQADKVIAACEKSGYFTKEDFAGATMAGVGKTAPQWGGPAIEPKTDIKFGEKKISLKMEGAVQAASAEAANTAKSMGTVVDYWLKENAERTISKSGEATAVEEVRKLFEEIKTEMINNGKKKLLASSRPKQVIKKINDLEDEAKSASLSPKSQEKLNKYIKYRDILIQKEFINGAGDILKDEFDYDKWQSNFGITLMEKIGELFGSLDVEADQDGTKVLSLQETLTDDLLSGRQTFGPDSPATAQYLVSPDHVFTLVPEDSGYDKTLKVFSKAVKLRVAPKGGRPLGSAKEGLNITVGAKPAFRYDIKPKDVEAAIRELEAQIEAASSEEEVAQIIDKAEDVISDSIEKIEEKVTELVSNSLDVPATVKSLTS